MEVNSVIGKPVSGGICSVWFISVSYEEVSNPFHLELENALESYIVGETVVTGQ